MKNASITLHNVESESKRLGHASEDRWYVFQVQEPSTPPTCGRVFARSSEKAMVLVRDAAIATDVRRPFRVVISRSFLVEDEVVQRTKAEEGP